MLSILAVDDDEIQCYAVERALRHLGYNVTCVFDGLTAVEQAATGSFDAILLDINLPDINGFEVCRRIRAMERIPQPAIVSYSGASGTHFAHKEGADAYLTFPVEPEHLSSVIKGVVQKRKPHPAAE